MNNEQQEWWQTVWNNESELLYLIDSFHPGYSNQHDIPITAQAAEDACVQIRKDIKTQCIDDPCETASVYIANKDSRLCSMLEETWFGLSESVAVHNLIGFDVLCDLCSESYIFYEDY